MKFQDGGAVVADFKFSKYTRCHDMATISEKKLFFSLKESDKLLSEKRTFWTSVPL